MKITTKDFPDCFPSRFREKLLKLGAKEQELKVFRICKSGLINEDAFVGTMEESLRKGKHRKFRNPDDVGNYSTSCHLKISDSRKILQHALRNPPHAIIAEGIIKPEKGLSQITAERKTDCTDSHVDWWIYVDAQPHLDFKKVSDHE